MERSRTCIGDTRCVRTNAPWLDAHFDLGLILGRLGKLAEAQKAFETVLKLQPGNADAKFWLGCTLSAEGQKEEARTKFKELADIDPGNELIQATLAAFDASAIQA